MVWKGRPFKVVLSLGNRKISPGKFRRLGWMGHEGCLMFCQITADEERRVNRRTVTVQQPSVVFPQFRPLPAHSIPHVLKLPGTTVCLPSDHMVQIHDRQCLSNQKTQPVLP